MAVLADSSDGFRWLPSEWGVSGVMGLMKETIFAFTPAGLASGVFEGIELSEMSNWQNSYHNIFRCWGGGDKAECGQQENR
ncbi:MAG TPA: hypothetical protein PLX18_08395 [Anaerohalosphaeraceae bacterium]|jgi:hypothetical protein|nr:hypothetical protein [Anaerohalosphaeraceae bacterium]HOT73367.1 hypothetical protein [Anaerohalosphaeraceae bacterium]HPB93453.1 hypothetical protein [Anaerohalosphaeraceae bacterium]HQG04995.1 hypothetical protein [Anaerohalosphaeraceae bacterium]HQI07862.1 hypothetical protein [Anaerohalosphaeraceae bacterium]